MSKGRRRLTSLGAGMALAALFVTGSLLLGGVPGAFAQSGDAAARNDHHSAAWLEAYEILGGVLTPSQQSTLNQLAYFAATANICDGLVLDEAKFGPAFEGLVRDATVEMDAEERVYFHSHLLVSFGVEVGIMLAEHTHDPASFCAEARDHWKDPEATHLFEGAEE